MSNSIKIDLYNLVKGALEGIIWNQEPLFRYVGHYNTPELDRTNNFAYDTPCAFISLNTIDWIHTKSDMQSQDLTREQDGLVNFTIHQFFHDLRTDRDSFVEHLEMVDASYRTIIGLRSPKEVQGKVSSMRRVREIDDFAFANLRHWQTSYQTRVQETGTKAGWIDSQPVQVIITPDVFAVDEIIVYNDLEDNVIVDNNDTLLAY